MSNEQGSRTSSSLLERLKEDREEAWDRFVELYAPLIYHWCRQKGLQPDDATDVGQEVFWAAGRGIKTFQHAGTRGAFRKWLRTITQNKIADFRRGRLGEAVARGGSDAHEEMLQLPQPQAEEEEPPETATEVSILCRRAAELIRGEFEERSWQAFWLVTCEERAPADVAAALDMTRNAVYVAKSRVLARLREEFAGLIDEGTV
jgi:RNA polymerase sigma-70 factor (ECF subfamily)